jgi:hypothetical protein
VRGTAEPSRRDEPQQTPQEATNPKDQGADRPTKVPAVNPTSEVPDTAAIAEIRNQSVGGGLQLISRDAVRLVIGWLPRLPSQAISRPTMETSHKRPKPAVCSRFRGGEA